MAIPNVTPSSDGPRPGEPVSAQSGMIGMAGGGAPMMMPPSGQSWMKPKPTEEDKTPDELEEIKPVITDPDSLVGKVNWEFSNYKSARMIQENGVFIRAFMNHKGVYASNMVQDGGTATPFVQVTSPKVRTALAMLMQIITPPGDNPWSLESPSEPLMIEAAYKALQDNVAVADIQPMMRELAGKVCERLSTKIEGGLDQTDFDIELLKVGQDCCLFGTGFMEGPLAAENVPVDTPDKDGDLNLWQRLVRKARETVGLAVTQEQKMQALVEAGIVDPVKPVLRSWSPFEVYLDPGARTIEQCRSIILRLVVSRQQLREWRGEKGFDADAINNVLNEAPDGNWKPESWESILAAANDNPNQSMPNGRFIVLKRWGMISGKDLQDAGLKVDEDQLEEQVMAQVWTCGNTLIRISVSDELHKDRIPIYAVPYMVSPHSMYGIGIAEMMFDSQAAVNACERAKMDNMAFICRPQVMIRVGALDLSDQQEAISFEAGKIWKIKETPLPPNGMPRPVDFWVPENALENISKTQQESMALSDEQTAIPRFLMGQNSDGVHNRTLGGATLQFDRAITPFKSVIFNFDHYFFTPLITKMGRFYQLFSYDASIKGDFKVVAQGVQGLMAREILSQKIGEALQAIGNNPQLSEEAASVVSPAKVLDKFIQGTGLAGEDLCYTPTEQVQRKQQAQQQQQQQAQQQLQQAMAPKLRAETPPKDALLDILKAAPDGSQTQLALIGQSAQAFGFVNPQLGAALQHDMEKAKMVDVAGAHELGHQVGERETTLPEAPPLPQAQ